MQVEDNGQGMSYEQTKRIFERGFSSKEGKLTGIGLHWCSNTINSMGGNMYAESDGPGNGSTIHLYFPKGE